MNKKVNKKVKYQFHFLVFAFDFFSFAMLHSYVPASTAHRFSLRPGHGVQDFGKYLRSQDFGKSRGLRSQIFGKYRRPWLTENG